MGSLPSLAPSAGSQGRVIQSHIRQKTIEVCWPVVLNYRAGLRECLRTNVERAWEASSDVLFFCQFRFVEGDYEWGSLLSLAVHGIAGESNTVPHSPKTNRSLLASCATLPSGPQGMFAHQC